MWQSKEQKTGQKEKREEKKERIFMLIERRSWKIAEMLGIKYRIWSCQGFLPALFLLSQCSLPIKQQAVARYWWGKSDELSMFEIIITVSMATRKCPPWLLFVFWARRHEVKVCRQKAVGREAGWGLLHPAHETGPLQAHMASSAGRNFGFGLLGYEREQESKDVCFPRFFITELLKSWYLLDSVSSHESMQEWAQHASPWDSSTLHHHREPRPYPAGLSQYKQ